MISLKVSMTCRSKSYVCLAMRSAIFIKFLPARGAQCRSRRAYGVKNKITRSDAACLTPQTPEYQNGKGVCAMGQALYPLPSQAPPCGHGRSRNLRLSDPSGCGGTDSGFDAKCRIAGTGLPLSSRPQTAFPRVGRSRTCQEIATGARRVCTAGSDQGIGPSHRNTPSDGKPPLWVGATPHGMCPSPRQGCRFCLSLIGSRALAAYGDADGPSAANNR